MVAFWDIKHLLDTIWDETVVPRIFNRRFRRRSRGLPASGCFTNHRDEDGEPGKKPVQLSADVSFARVWPSRQLLIEEQSWLPKRRANRWLLMAVLLERAR